MPFVNQEHRKKPDWMIPGDRCYEEYKKIMTAWKLAPRWGTVDAIAKYIWPDDWKRALILAFLVFFAFHVLPYEEKKRIENGDIN